MINSINKIICETVNEAINKKSKELERDVTYVCRVEEIFQDSNMYRLRHDDKSYIVSLTNITPNLYDLVHLVLPKGNLKDKYVIEDICNASYGESPELVAQLQKKNEELENRIKELENILAKVVYISD